jgi:S-adenosylmethionine-dependent methyltransferase
MWHAVHDALAHAPTDQVLDVLDLGGGTGVDAVRVAGLGHRVTVVDPNADALASLERRAQEASVVSLVTAIQADADGLAGHVQAASFDVVLCHGVLEVVDDVEAALDAVRQVMRPGAVLSIVVAGRNAAVLARSLAGDFEAAGRLAQCSVRQWDLSTMGPRRFTLDEVENLVTSRQFVVEARQGLRVVADLVPSAIADIEPGAREGLYVLERMLGSSPDFRGLSAGLHTIARLDLVSEPSTPGGHSATL